MAKIKDKEQAEAGERLDPGAKTQTPKLGPSDFQNVMDRVARVIKPYSRPIGIGAAGLLVVIIAGIIWSGVQEKKAGEATAELGKVLDTASARVEDSGPDIEALTTGREPEPARFKTFKDRSEAEIAAVQAFESTHGSSTVAKRAKLVQAGALYDLGKYDEAVAAYKIFLESGPGPEVALVAREGIGYALEAKALAQADAAARNAGLDEALKAYTDIAANDKDPGHATALYHQARIRALKGDKPGAIELYNKVLKDNPGLILTEQITGRLALLGVAPEPKAPVAPVPAPAPGK